MGLNGAVVSYIGVVSNGLDNLGKSSNTCLIAPSGRPLPLILRSPRPSHLADWLVIMAKNTRQRCCSFEIYFPRIFP